MVRQQAYPWTHMLYMAAPIVRLRTVLELRETQPTWIGCAEGGEGEVSKAVL